MGSPRRSRSPRRPTWVLPLLSFLTAAGCGERAAAPRRPDPDGPVASGTAVTADTAVELGDVTVAGRVLDDESGAGLGGGYVIVLAPGVSFAEWERSPDEEVEDLMAGAAVTDSLGRYEIADLPRGLDFTVVVAARGHEPAIFERGLAVQQGDPPLTRLADVRLETR